MDELNSVLFGGLLFVVFLYLFFMKRNKTHSSPPEDKKPASMKDDPWCGWSVHQSTINNPGHNGCLSIKSATEQYVARDFSILLKSDDKSECLAIPPTFVKGTDPNRPGKLGEEAEETVYDALKNNQIQGLKIVFFNSQRYMGKKDIMQETKIIIREKDFSIFLEFEGKFYIMFIEVKCIEEQHNTHRKKTTSQLKDHCKVLEITHEIPASELDKIMLHSAWPRLSREYTCPKCQKVHNVFQGVPDECSRKNIKKQPEPTYEEPGWHIFKESFGSQGQFDKWIKHSMKEGKAMDKAIWTNILSIHTKQACGALYEEISKTFLLLGADQVALRDSPKHELDMPKFVPGLAGTGKTTTTCAMIEKLFKDSEVNSEHKVLYICFSDFFIDFVKKSLKQLECKIDMDLIEFRNYKTSNDIKGFLKNKQILDQIIFDEQFRYIFFDQAEDLGVKELTKMIGEFTSKKKLSESKDLKKKYPLGHFWILFDVIEPEVDTCGLSVIAKHIKEGKKEDIIWPLKTAFGMTRNIAKYINQCLNRDLVNPEETGIEGPEVDIKMIKFGKDVDPANIPIKVAEILLPVVQDVYARNIHPGQVAILFDTEDIKLVHLNQLADVINSLNTLIKNHYHARQQKLFEITKLMEESILKTHESLLYCNCKMFIGSVEEVKGFTVKLVVHVPFFRSDGITPLSVGNKFVSRISPYYKAISRSSCEVQIKQIILDDDLLFKLDIPQQDLLRKKDNCPVDYWKQMLREFIPDVEKVNKFIWAIKELYDIEQVFEMAIEAFLVIQRDMERTLSTEDLKILTMKYSDEQFRDFSSTFTELVAISVENRDKDLEKEFSEHTFSTMKRCWKGVLRKMLPDFPILAEAIETLYPKGETELLSLATIQQIQRFSDMGVTSMAQFSYIIDNISKDLSQDGKQIFPQHTYIEQEADGCYYSLYDVIIHQELPKTEEEKKDLMEAIKESLDLVKYDTFLQEFLVSKHNLLAEESGLEPLGSIRSFDWNNLQIEVINIFFGSRTHCLIKMRLLNSEKNYDLSTITDINKLIKIAVESIDTFTRKNVSVEKPIEWRGENSGELSVHLTWDKSFFKSLLNREHQDEDMQKLAIDLIRKVPAEMQSDDQKKNLKTKLCSEYGFLPQSADDLIKQFEKIPFTERDAMEVDIEMSCGKSSPMKKVASNVPLWPYLERKLNEIDDTHIRTGFSGLCIQEDLPVNIADVFITFLDIFNGNEDLRHQAFEQKKASEPFHTIFDLYKEGGGTLGGWLHAFERLRDNPGRRAQKAFENEDARRLIVNSIISGTMEIYNEWHSRWEGYYKDLPRLITNFEEFEDQFKTHGISNFQRMGGNDLKNQLKVADQIWLFRDTFGGYAHVLFYLGRYVNHDTRNPSAIGNPHHYVVHVHQNNAFQTHKGIGIIKEDKFDDVFKQSDKGFIVRIENLSKEQRDQMVARARACINPDLPPIQFSYNGFSGNCESLVNAFYGLWDDEKTSQQGNEASTGSRRHSAINKIARALVFATKRGSDKDLRNKIKERFKEHNLDI